MAVFSVVVPCSLIEVYELFRGICCLHRGVKLLPDYMALQPRKQAASYSSTWEPRFLLRFSEYHIPLLLFYVTFLIYRLRLQANLFNIGVSSFVFGSSRVQASSGNQTARLSFVDCM
jgi:hypothetical protein